MYQIAPRNQSNDVLRWAIGLLIAIAAAAVIFAICFLLINGGMAGSKKELIIAGLIAALPVMLYAGATKPFVFPLGLYVLLVPFDNLLSLDPRYGTVTKLVAICAGLALVFSLIRSRRIVMPPQAMFVWLSLLVLMALSVFWAIDTPTAITNLVTYAELIGLTLVISITPINTSDFRVLAATVIAGSLLASVYAIHLFHSGVDVQNAQINQQLTSRVFVTAGDSDKHIDPNAFAAALLFPISLVMMLTLQRKWSFMKLVFLGILLILLGGVYVTASRGAEVALGMMMVYLIVRSRYRGQVLLLSIVGLGAVLLKTDPFARFADALRTGGAGRLSIWKVGWLAFKQHWLLGSGVGNFPFAYDKTFILVYEEYNAKWHRAAHNMPLVLAVELGIIGLIVGLLAWYLQWRTLRFIGRSDPLYDLRISLESAIVGLFFASLFLSNLGDKYVWLGFTLIVAARSLALGRIGMSKTPSPPRHVATGDQLVAPFPQKVPEHA